ncbi:fructose-like phosphotransferase system subunit EIIA [Listeria fleischmannii 1991]|nr:PTS fructose transporter subunit IIA [Listeria fleischmannii]KMT57922.1 fructose-like phosphotransferase system subunit EIIA [Listeria fleischmannii 1991]
MMTIMVENGINLQLEGNTKEEILSNIAEVAYQTGKVSNTKLFFEDLCKREQESTTGFGGGIAIPHAKSDAVKEVGVLFFRSKEQIEWQAMDGEPVFCFICLMVPSNGGEEHLKLLSKLSRKMIDPDFVSVLKTSGETEILSLIRSVIS